MDKQILSTAKTGDASPGDAETFSFDLRQGLGEEEAKEARRRFGANILTRKKKDGFLRQFLGNFSDPIIRILLGALVLNIVVSLGDVNWLECGGIAAAILIATLVSTISEYSSAAAFDTLCSQAEDSPFSVRREGTITSVRVSEMVVGDVIQLSSGCTVPADGYLIRGIVRSDQSSLTGESAEKKKMPDPRFSAEVRGRCNPADTVWSADDEHLLLRGSRICAGEGEMLAARVGDRTFYGGVAADLQENTRLSPLKQRLTVLARSVSFLGYLAAGGIAFAYLFNVLVIDSGMNGAVIREKLTDWRFLLPQLIHALSAAISVLVVAVPEGLPMMITVVLSSNMKKMLADHVLVRRLVGIETAGSLNILFTDKTGTLTCGKLKVASVIGAEQSYDSLTALRKCPPLCTSLAENHAVCSSEGKGNATDQAMRAFFGRQIPDMCPVCRVSFDSSRRYSSGVVRENGEERTLIRGAPEGILPYASRYLGEDGRLHPMTPAMMSHIRQQWNKLAQSAHRVIAAAEYSGRNETETGDFSDLTFLALMAIRDRIRPEAAEAVHQAHQAGIQTVMITGDNPLTAGAIARDCGIFGREREGVILTGGELSAMSDEEVKAVLPRLSVVARALPTDKSRLVRLAQQLGFVTGMTGDGINDAPALRAADVGFAMGSGTDAAREAASIVITDDRFSSIMKAVLYGRTVLRSIRKFIVFQLTMNLCAVGVSLIGPFIGVETPVTVIQMLWVNIIMDTLGALAFAGEPSLEEYMRCPPLSREEKLLSGEMIRRILWCGGYTLLLCLWFLRSPSMHTLFSRGDEVYYLTVFFALFIFCGIFQCFLARADGLNLLKHLPKNRSFLWIIALVAVVQLMILYFGGTMFRCEPLTARELMLAALLAFTVIPAGILARYIGRGRK